VIALAERQAATTVDPRVIDLLLSRLVGQRGTRRGSYQICHLVGGIHGVPGPFYNGSQNDELNEQVNALWRQVRRREMLLPDDVVRRYFPERLDTAIAEVIALGPVEFVDAVCTHLTELATGIDEDGIPLPRDPDGSAFKTLGDGAIESRIKAAKKLASELIELRKRSQALGLGKDLDEWTLDNLPKFPTPKSVGAEMRRVDRSAPPLLYVRRCLRDLTAEIDRRLRRTGRRRHEGTMRLLRNRVIIVLCALGLRSATVRRLLVEDFIPEFEVSAGVFCPALRLRHLKQLPGVVRYFPLPPLFASWIQQYLDYLAECGFDPEPTRPLILPGRRSSWRNARRPSGRLINQAVIRTLLPYSNGRLYSPHTLRHLCEQFAVRAGADWLRENEADADAVERPSGIGVPVASQTFADVTLDHALHDIADRYGDRDNEPARQWWRRIAALGLVEYYCGDRGAPKGIDLDDVRRARARLQDLHAEASRRAAKIAALEQKRDALEERKLQERRRALRDADALDGSARFRVQLQLDELNDEIMFFSRALESELRQLPQHELMLQEAQRQVRDAATTLKPMPDDSVPLRSLEGTEFEEPAENEQVGSLDDAPILRRVFDLREFHWALGGPTALSAEQLRRYVRGASAWQCLFDDDGTGKPKGVFRPTPRKCVIAFDDLPLERYPVEVVERLDALMRQPPRKPFARAA
jgi:hypothetical protein